MQVSLYLGSLSGSRLLLQQLARVPVSAPSPSADLICAYCQQQGWIEPQPHDPIDHSQSSTWLSQVESSTFTTTTGGSPAVTMASARWYQPQEQTLQALHKALQQCKKRIESQERTKQNYPTEDVTHI
jgi:hypothetical protein